MTTDPHPNCKGYTMATCKSRFMINGQEFSGIPVLNPGEWFGKAFLIEMYNGTYGERYVIEADNESGAIDEFVDHPLGRQLVITEPDLSDYDEEELTYAGNAGEPVCLDNVSIRRIDPETLYYDDIKPSEIW